MKTFAEQVADLKATRAAKAEEMKGVAQKSMDEGRSMDNAEAERGKRLFSDWAGDTGQERTPSTESH